MTITNQPTDILLQRKQGLDNYLMMSVVAGVAVPEEMQNELFELQSELEKRGVSERSRDTMAGWLGTEVDGFGIKKPIRQSHSSYVYLARVR